MRLLIVDDSKTMRAILASYARELGCETAEAEDGCAALERLASDAPFDAALVDWDMPRMDGFELVKAIRARPDCAGVKLMMVTSQNSMDRVAAALGNGADDYLMKPLDQEMLAGKLRLLGLVA